MIVIIVKCVFCAVIDDHVDSSFGTKMAAAVSKMYSSAVDVRPLL